MQTCGSDIPVNIYAEPESDQDLAEGDICAADICGVCYDLEVYPDEDAYYASDTPFAAMSMVPVGVFSSGGNADESPPPGSVPGAGRRNGSGRARSP